MKQRIPRSLSLARISLLGISLMGATFLSGGACLVPLAQADEVEAPKPAEKKKPAPSQLRKAAPEQANKTAETTDKQTPKNAEPTSKAAPEQANKPAPPAQAASSTPPNPHSVGARGMQTSRPPQSQSRPDGTLPTGTVVVEVLDEFERPLAGATVNLLTLFQSVAEGNTEDIEKKVTDEAGRVRFNKLDTAIRFSYAVSVESRGATYDVPSFRLGKVGQRVTIPTFATTTDPREAFVGIQGYFTVQVNDDLLRIDGAYRVFNMGQKTWTPNAILIRLPEDVQAVDAKLSAGDAGFEEAPGGMKLVGSFPPGQKDLTFSFHVPNTNTATRTIAVGVPPHSVDLNVLIEEAPGMGLSVSPAFPPAESRMGRNDKKVLVTRRVLRPGDGVVDSIQIELSGLPVIGPGRWIATFVALGIALLGLLATWMKRRESEVDTSHERDKARDTLLDEMLLLERAHRGGQIGPRTYEETRREILVALARLEPDTSAA